MNGIAKMGMSAVITTVLVLLVIIASKKWNIPVLNGLVSQAAV